MRQESEYDLLRAKLDTLESTDLTGNWHSGDAWLLLKSRTEKVRSRRIRVLVYCSAAAAVIVVGIFIFSGNEQARLPMPAIVHSKKTMLEAALPGTKPATLEYGMTTAQQTILPEHIAIVRRKNKRSETLAVKEELIRATEISAPIIISDLPKQAEKPIVKHTCVEPIYTLDEIRSNVPEQAEQPKIYTGIFGREAGQFHEQDNDEHQSRLSGFLHKN